MDKTQLQQRICHQLEADLELLMASAEQARQAATHEESKAENKYDTRGLEASYLAAGQSQRVEELRQTLHTWRQLKPRPFNPERGIELGALIQLVGPSDQSQWLFLGPPGAAFKLPVNSQSIQVIGSSAPLGRLLLGKQIGDSVTLSLPGKQQDYEVLEVI